jgi:hypothetical protein
MRRDLVALLIVFLVRGAAEHGAPASAGNEPEYSAVPDQCHLYRVVQEAAQAAHDTAQEGTLPGLGSVCASAPALLARDRETTVLIAVRVPGLRQVAAQGLGCALNSAVGIRLGAAKA